MDLNVKQKPTNNLLWGYCLLLVQTPLVKKRHQ